MSNGSSEQHATREQARRFTTVFDAPFAWSDEHVLQSLAARDDRRGDEQRAAG